jgi:hypothetical protein
MAALGFYIRGMLEAMRNAGRPGELSFSIPLHWTSGIPAARRPIRL